MFNFVIIFCISNWKPCLGFHLPWTLFLFYTQTISWLLRDDLYGNNWYETKLD